MKMLELTLPMPIVVSIFVLIAVSFVIWLLAYIKTSNGQYRSAIISRRLVTVVLPILLSIIVFFVITTGIFTPIISILCCILISSFAYQLYSISPYVFESRHIKNLNTPFALYLRCFAIDNNPKSQQAEVYITKVLRKILPLVAVGVPDRILPIKGAYRMYLTNDEWESSVELMAKKSSLIIMRPNRSEGCQKELSLCAQYISKGKVLYVISSYEELEALCNHECMQDYNYALEKLKDIFCFGRILCVRFTSNENFDAMDIHSFDKRNMLVLGEYIKTNIGCNKDEGIKYGMFDSIWHTLSFILFPFAYMSLYGWSKKERLLSTICAMLCVYCVMRASENNLHSIVYYGGRFVITAYLLYVIARGYKALKISNKRAMFLTHLHFNHALMFAYVFFSVFVTIMAIMIFALYHSLSLDYKSMSVVIKVGSNFGFLFLFSALFMWIGYKRRGLSDKLSLFLNTKKTVPDFLRFASVLGLSLIFSLLTWRCAVYYMTHNETSLSKSKVLTYITAVKDICHPENIAIQGKYKEEIKLIYDYQASVRDFCTYMHAINVGQRVSESEILVEYNKMDNRIDARYANYMGALNSVTQILAALVKISENEEYCRYYGVDKKVITSSILPIYSKTSQLNKDDKNNLENIKTIDFSCMLDDNSIVSLKIIRNMNARLDILISK